MCVRGEIATGGREPTRSDEGCVGQLEEFIIDPVENRGSGRAGKKKGVPTILESERRDKVAARKRELGACRLIRSLKDYALSRSEARAEA
jgi:hypothetical protein